jgi:nitrogen regulatory protein PII
MKLIQCIVRPEKINDIVDRIEGMASGLTVSDVRGHGHQKGQPTVYRGLEYQVSLLPKTMVEIVADDSRVDDIIRIVTATAKTGQIGDGRIFVVNVDQCYHVRTGLMD